MVNYFRKYSWIIIVMLCIIGGTIYYMVTGGSGFTMGTDSEKIGIVSGDTSLFIWYDDMESVNMVDIPEDFGTEVAAGTGNNTVYGSYKNDKYGLYTVYLYTKKQTQCIEIIHKDGVLLINDSSAKKTQSLYDTLISKTGLQTEQSAAD